MFSIFIQNLQFPSFDQRLSVAVEKCICLLAGFLMVLLEEITSAFSGSLGSLDALQYDDPVKT